MKTFVETPIVMKEKETFINELIKFIELRFGVYLDSIHGFIHNIYYLKTIQKKISKACSLTVEELDKLAFIRGNGPPSSNIEESKSREIHRMTQGNFKKNNSPGGANYDFAIENCLSDIFNYWNNIKKRIVMIKIDNLDAIPVFDYMRKLRNRITHDIPKERIEKSKCGPIELKDCRTLYKFPTFEVGQTIYFSEKDIEALVIEIRTQIDHFLT